MTEKEMNLANSERAVCNMLRTQRLRLNLSQREIANALEYRNVNYVSMLENTNSRIPFVRIPAIVEAYQLPKTYIALMIRELYPDYWGLLKEIISDILPSLKEDNC